MALLFEDKVSKEFADKVRYVALKLGIDPNWLMMVMKSESEINHKAVNKWCLEQGGSADSCAVGLIQFMPATAAGLGTSTRALYNMSALQQLDYVYKYYKPYKDNIKSFYDLYLMTFYPAAIGKPNSFKIGSERSQSYARQVSVQNKIIDMDGDGYVTVADFKKFIKKKNEDYLSFGIRTRFFLRKYWWIPVAALAVGTGGFIYYLYKKDKL
jgi:hypothetical protein